MRTVVLPNGEAVPALGLGTWHMGESRSEHAREVAAIRAGIEAGMTLIDTAEMYAEGGAERVVGEAIAGQRDKVFIVSKVYPHNASATGAIKACERSLKRLGTDCIDLYLLHWRGGVPLQETVDAFERLKSEGKIRQWGVSNFDTSDMEELSDVRKGGSCVTNQVLYHLGERGIEWDLLPACEGSGIPIMAYSPLGQGRILDDQVLAHVGNKHGVTSAAVAIAWVMRNPNIIAIPKTSDATRVEQNFQAADLVLDPDDLALLDGAFPPPAGPSSLAIL